MHIVKKSGPDRQDQINGGPRAESDHDLPGGKTDNDMQRKFAREGCVRVRARRLGNSRRIIAMSKAVKLGWS